MQGKLVASPAMIEEVKKFQRQSRIPVTGSVDYKTLSAAAGLKSRDVLYRSADDIEMLVGRSTKTQFSD